MRIAPLLLIVLASLATPTYAGEETSDEWFAWHQARADELLAAGRVDEAVEELFACAAIKASAMGQLADAAILAIESGVARPGGLTKTSRHYRVAEDLIRHAVSRGGKGDARLAFAIGRLRWVDRDFALAHDMFKEAYEGAEAVGLDVEMARRWYYRGLVNRAGMLIEAARFDEAIEDIGIALELVPGHGDEVAAKINLADAHRHRDERKRSEEILLGVVKEHPDAARAWHTLGQVLNDMGRLDDALDAFDRSILKASATRIPFDDTLVAKARVLLRMGRLDECERAAEGYLAVRRDAPAGLFLLAMIQKERGEPYKAVKILRRAHRLSPEDETIMSSLGRFLFELGEVEEGERIQDRLEKVRAKRRAPVDGAPADAVPDDAVPDDAVPDDAAPDDAAPDDAAPEGGDDAAGESPDEPAPTPDEPAPTPDEPAPTPDDDAPVPPADDR